MPRSTVTSRASSVNALSRGPAHVAACPESLGRSGDESGPTTAPVPAPCGFAHAPAIPDNRRTTTAFIRMTPALQLLQHDSKAGSSVMTSVIRETDSRADNVPGHDETFHAAPKQSRTHLLGLRQTVSGAEPRLRQRHDSNTAPGRALRR